ncbi:MAG: hypothetical protein ACAI35_26205 [Candidatus Methylacidiphilales bacterium]
MAAYRSPFLLLLLLSVLACDQSLGQTQSAVTVEVTRKPGKPGKTEPVRLVGDIPGNIAARPPDARSTYGGDARTTSPKGATGFFRVEQIGNESKSWTLVDPEGHPFFNLAIVGVRSANGKSQVTADALTTKYGTSAKWAAETTQFLLQHGFNGTGAWSETEVLRATTPRLPYTHIWNFMSSYGRKRGDTTQLSGHMGYPQSAIFVFDPEFEAFCDQHAQKLEAMKDDPWLIGHFSDNEMPLPPDALDKFLSLPETEAGHKAAAAWLSERRKTPVTAADAKPAQEERNDFLRHVAERYYEIVSKAIRKHDPNHLYLGSRFYGGNMKQQALWQAAGKYCDVVSVNVYGMWTPLKADTDNWATWSGRPFMVTEWYAKGMDSGMPNVSGAGFVVPTQADRAKFYQHFVLGMMEMPACVGLHWFRYMDNDPADTSVDPSNRDSNKGIVNIKFETYKPLTDGMKELNDHVYTLLDILRLKK